MKNKITSWGRLFWKVSFVLLVMVSVSASYAVLASEVSAPVLQTGQTQSLTNGDDGSYKTGIPWPVPRFTDQGNGEITDHLTSLIWMNNANCWGRLTWADALAKVAALNAGTASCTGYTVGTHKDWRLPNRQELESLIDYGHYNPALPSGHPFTGVENNYYWSSTTDAITTSYAWIVYLYDGYVDSDDKTSSNYVWPVRGGQ